MIEYAIPKTQAVTPEPQVKTIGLEGFTRFCVKILANSVFVLKAFVSWLMQSLKGMFFEPTMQPLFNPGRGSSTFPSKRSRLLASTV